MGASVPSILFPHTHTSERKSAVKVHWVRVEQTRDHSCWTEWNRVALLCKISKHFAFPITHDSVNVCCWQNNSALSVSHTGNTTNMAATVTERDCFIHISCLVCSVYETSDIVTSVERNTAFNDVLRAELICLIHSECDWISIPHTQSWIHELALHMHVWNAFYIDRCVYAVCRLPYQ